MRQASDAPLSGRGDGTDGGGSVGTSCAALQEALATGHSDAAANPCVSRPPGDTPRGPPEACLCGVSSKGHCTGIPALPSRRHHWWPGVRCGNTPGAGKQLAVVARRRKREHLCGAPPDTPPPGARCTGPAGWVVVVVHAPTVAVCGVATGGRCVWTQCRSCSCRRCSLCLFPHTM